MLERPLLSSARLQMWSRVLLPFRGGQGWDTQEEIPMYATHLRDGGVVLGRPAELPVIWSNTSAPTPTGRQKG